MLSIAGSLRKLGLSALAAAAALSSLASAAPSGIQVRSLEERAASGNRLVFCHFMIGVVWDRTSAADYDADMQRAKAAGIDAFALNIGTDDYTVTQLNYAYQSAANNGMKVFISFDFNWYHPATDAGTVGSLIAQYKNQPAQLQVNGRVFASSFAGDGLDVDTVRSVAGTNVYFVPNFHPGQSSTSNIDGALNWMAWDNNGNNKAPSNGANVSVAQGDASYQSWLGGKTYLAPVSAWFSTHYGPEVSYCKNWVFPGGALIFNRWQEVLQQGFPMVEIITWNDYGESHYMGPLNSKHGDDGNSKWTNDMPHDGFLDLSTPFIAAYKNGDTNVANYIQDEKVVYWYRRNLKSLNCDATDTTSGHTCSTDTSGNYFEGVPNGYQTMDDDVYVVTLLKSAATLTVTSGGNTQTFNAPAGANIYTVSAGLGKQSFAVSRNGQNFLSGTSLMDITDVCSCGIYNFNPYVGTLPAGFNDPLGPDGLASLTVGLHVTTCQAQPSLGTNPSVPVSTPHSTPAQPTSSNNPPASRTSSAAPSDPTNCNGGTNAAGQSGNFAGLCSFACSFGYCPVGPCTCTSFGAPGTPPASNGRNGCPLSGEPDSYKGLCSYACSKNYCPEGACQYC